MKKGKKIVMVMLAVLPVIMLFAVYKKLPEMVPMQWGIDGVSRYGEKWELIPVAGLNIFIGILMPLLAKIDPKKQNYKRFLGTYETITILIMTFIVIMVGLTLVETFQPGTFSVPKVVNGMVAVLFILLGNMMPKVKQNYFTGVKTPWSLSNDVVWNKTQRLGGKAFFFGGILMLICTIFAPLNWMGEMVVAVTLFICIVPVIMSYVWYQQEVKNGENTHDEG